MSNAIAEKQFVGIDLHLHRSVIVRIDERGQQLDCVQIDNDPKTLVREVRKAGRGAPPDPRGNAPRLHATNIVAEECLAAPGCRRCRHRQRSRPQLHTTPRAWCRRESRSWAVCASLGWPQHRSSSLRCGRCVLTPPSLDAAQEQPTRT